jgi:gluconolactonase
MTTRSVMGMALLVALVGLGTPVPAQRGGPPREARVVRLDPALDAIVPAGATIEKVADGFQFTEGPVWSRDGELLFSDIPANIIYRLTSDGERSVYRQPAGYDGPPQRPGQHIGSNGLTLDRQGRLIVAEHGNRRITRVEPGGRLTVLADRYEGKRLNSPNDLVVKSDGAIYFSDPPYGLPLADEDPAKELPYSGIFRIKDGKIDLLSTAMTRPNGMGLSPDERTLYVANSDPEERHWMRFDVRADGTLGPGSIFYDASGSDLPGFPDGLTLDAAGNLYATGPAGVWVISPDAKVLGRIEAPEQPANAAFGDDGKTLYITARRSVYRIRLNAMGLRPCC